MYDCSVGPCTDGCANGLSRISRLRDFFFNPGLPSIDLYAWDNYNTTQGQVGIIEFGEWFHLPQASGGYVDSVTVEIDSTSADTVFVALFQAWTLDAYPFFTANPSRYYAATFAKGSMIHGPSRVMFAFNHTLVPQDFVVGIEPNINYAKGTYNSVALRADIEQPLLRTAENTRSNFLYVNGFSAYGQVIDSVLIPYSTTTPIYSNFDITAYVPEAASSVSEDASTMNIELFPNPAHNQITCECGPHLGVFHIELFDLLGRQVLSQPIQNGSTLDVSSLESGRYVAICSISGGIVSTPVMIEK